MIEEFFDHSPYELDKEDKDKLITKELLELTKLHEDNCDAYRRFLSAVNFDPDSVHSAEDIPFFPVRLFKERELLSIPKEEVFKVMTSSGTTGGAVSKIYIDKENAMLQNKVMLRILADFWGKKRLPMLVIDSPSVLKDRKSFSARGAAVMGLLIASKDTVYALNDDMSLNTEAVASFLDKYKASPFIIFGFTFMVWKHLYQAALEKDIRFDLRNAWLMTGGGWKKLKEDAVTNDEFKKRIREAFGIEHFLDHYGMVEQTGCIYAECEYGHLHASIFSDVIPRNYKDFSPCEIGQPGILETISVLPHSYPGHALLTEDEGVVLGVDDCPCGRKGKYIEIIGRLKNAELRGCSDTYATSFG